MQFRSELVATWAAFFDLAGWRWDINPVAVNGWTPDFRVSFDCSHSECGGSHSLVVAVKPFETIEQFDGHLCLEYDFGGYDAAEGGIGKIPVDGAAALGVNPRVSRWVISHGSGGGQEDMKFRVNDCDRLWAEAKTLIQA